MRYTLDNDGNLHYLLTDHLGSVVAITNSAGVLEYEQRYLPFGAVRELSDYVTTQPVTDFGYTGQRKLDIGMGDIMDYKARFYSPYLNRFLQPDTIIPDYANPQAWDRYAFVNNNPVRFNDPTGHMVSQGEDGGDNQCPSTKGLEGVDCIITTSWTHTSRTDLADDLEEFEDDQTESERNGQIAGGVAGTIAGAIFTPIAGAACVPEPAAIIACPVAIAVTTSIIAGATDIAHDYFGGTAADMYGSAWSAANATLGGSQSTSFTVSRTTTSLVSSNNGKVISSNTVFNISGGDYSKSFSANDNTSLFVNPVQVISQIFGFLW